MVPKLQHLELIFLFYLFFLGMISLTIANFLPSWNGTSSAFRKSNQGSSQSIKAHFYRAKFSIVTGFYWMLFRSRRNYSTIDTVAFYDQEYGPIPTKNPTSTYTPSLATLKCSTNGYSPTVNYWPQGIIMHGTAIIYLLPDFIPILSKDSIQSEKACMTYTPI